MIVAAAPPIALRASSRAPHDAATWPISPAQLAVAFPSLKNVKMKKGAGVHRYPYSFQTTYFTSSARFLSALLLCLSLCLVALSAVPERATGYPRTHNRKMLKSSFFRSLSATAALTGPAVQNVLAQQCCCFASKTQPPYLKDATAKAPKPKTKTTKTIKQKRPPSGYTLFIKDRGAGAAGPGMFTRLAQEWKGLSEAQKAPYLSQAAALKAETQQVRRAVAQCLPQ